jgi:hypothetical protein
MSFSLLYRALFAAIRCLMFNATVDEPLESEIDCVAEKNGDKELTVVRCISVALLTDEVLVRSDAFLRSADRSRATVR